MTSKIFNATAQASGVPPKVEACVPGPSKSANGARTQNAPMGNPPPSDLAIERPSGRKSDCAAGIFAFENPLEALEFSGAEMSALHAVHEQQQFFLVAQPPQAEQIFRRGGRDAAFALHAFNQNGDCRRRNGFARRFQIVERNVPEARHHRLETFFNLVLAGGGDARQRAAMKGICRRDDLKTAFVVAEFARELEQSFVRLRAAVAKKTLPAPMRFTISAASRPCGSVKYKFETWMSFWTARRAPR
jgi:hypothetical protein